MGYATNGLLIEDSCRIYSFNEKLYSTLSEQSQFGVIIVGHIVYHKAIIFVFVTSLWLF